MTAVGISIGTSNSSVAVFKDGNVTILTNERGNKLTPSVVALDDQALLCGEEACDRMQMNPESTVCDSKRLIGRGVNDGDLEELLNYWPFQVVSDQGRYYYIIRRGGEKIMVAPEEVMAVLISKMKRLAEEFIEGPVEEAVLTVPVCFGANQRVALKHAGFIAGFRTVHLVNEATAVALAYFFDRKLHEPFQNQKQTVMVCNLGGGSTDATTFTLQNNKVKACATNGCAYLGGANFTNNIGSHIAMEIKNTRNIRVFQDCGVIMRIMNYAERAKKELTTRSKTLVKINQLYPGFTFESVMTKLTFEGTLDTKSLLQIAIHSCVRDTEPALEEVFMTGGSSRIPYLRNLVHEATSMTPDTSLHAEESSAFGAAVAAASIGGTSPNVLGAVEIVDVIPVHVKASSVLGGDQILFRRNTPIQSESCYRLPLPDNPKGNFTIKVYEGDNLLASSNTYIGQVIINLQERMYQPEEQIRVYFEIDSCGIVNVPRVELVLDNSSVNFSFERSTACMSEERVARYKEKFPVLGIRC